MQRAGISGANIRGANVPHSVSAAVGGVVKRVVNH